MHPQETSGKHGYRLWLALGDTLLRRSIRQCVSDLGLEGDEDVMDFGCGPGLVSLHLARMLQRGHLTCVDVSEAATAAARNRLRMYSSVDFLSGDIRERQPGAAAYDVVFMNFVYYHIDVPERHGTIKRLVQLLKEGGRLVLRNPVSKRSGITPEAIRAEFGQLGLREVSGGLTRSLLFIPTYTGVYKRTAEAP